ncbi:MAG: hypothetical protein OEV40_14420 [Acidimicrobiia bacterium]|nr:hypothetical protein [Acidimicrobiia bacterium]
MIVSTSNRVTIKPPSGPGATSPASQTVLESVIPGCRMTQSSIVTASPVGRPTASDVT